MFEYNDLDYLKNKLKTDLENGLSNEEVLKRQKNNGANILEDKKRDSFFKIFFLQLKDPMIYILLVAIAVSIFLKEYSDSIVVLIVVLLNAFIGAFQEIKTEKALEMLKKLSSNKCNVVRNGKKIQIDASELVKGDLVFLESGSSVGADIRLIEANNLSIDESSITGESQPVKKNVEKLDKKIISLGDKLNLAYMSTLVVSGSGKGIVVSTSMATEIGKIAKLLKDDQRQITPLQKRLSDLGKLLGILTIGICGIMFIIALLEKRNPLDMIVSSISLAVAAIPEGLPAVVTIVLAIGVQRMVKVNSIVKRLPSVETLGAVSVVCSDKTGTLTENKLKCVGVYQNGNFSSDISLIDNDLILNIGLCNNAYKNEDKYIGTPMETALLYLLEVNNISFQQFTRVKELEFDSNRKMMSTLNIVENVKKQYTKGAYDRIISKCKYVRINGENRLLTKQDVENLNKKVDEQAGKARRILAFAYKQGNDLIEEFDMVFLGFITFIDPPREGVKEAIEKFKNAGVKTVMITGDYIKTAYAIGKDIGIAKDENECISGDELDVIEDNELIKIVDKKSIFARVSPLHKSRIVNAFKANGRVVAMTGDGVNDAPSLKKADIGISMGITGNDVAKEASDMILLDDNFSTIETAIEEGRTIYNNIKKSVLFLLSSNFAEIIVMMITIILGLPLPLLAIHILVVNLLTDSIPALALGADGKDSDIMNEPPRNPQETLFARGGLVNTVVYGVLIAVLTLFAFLIPSIGELLYLGVDFTLYNIKAVLINEVVLSRSQTFAFIVLSLSELFYSLSIRNINKSVIRKDILNNKFLDLAIVGGVLLIGGMLYIPFIRDILKLQEVTILIFISLVVLSASILGVHELVFRIVSHETSSNITAISDSRKKQKKVSQQRGKC